VAYNLGIPAYQLYAEMPYTELLKWVEFFNRRPVGWREDQRTYLYLRTQGVKEKSEDLFPTLGLMAKNRENLQVPDKAVPKGTVLEMMIKARNGDTSDWNPIQGENNVDKSQR